MTTESKAYREQLGLTKAEMARLMGVHWNTWHKWETGEHPAPACAMQYMAVLLSLKLHAPKAYSGVRKKHG